MFHLRHLISLVLVSFFVHNSHTVNYEEIATGSESQLEQIQSPMLEVLMHLPPNFRSLKNSLGIKPERLKTVDDSRLKRTADHKSIVDVRSYEIAQPAPVRFGGLQNNSDLKRSRREATPGTDAPILENANADKSVSSLHGSRVVEKYQDAGPGTMLPVPDAIRGPAFSTYPVKEFDVVDIDDPDDPRRRRNESVDERDDKRDKRTFLEEGDLPGEATTPLPFWKRKKESPPFITGRRESVQKGNIYTPPQHRSADSARESHSLKNLDKTVQSNEINRSNQDNYYASTNRRTYSRQSDNVASSTPKSVYDTIDYSSSSNGKRSQEGGRDGRNYEEKKETLRDGRTHEQYNRQYHYNHPTVYDRSYYPPPYLPPYPYPSEVVGRGVEFYHRTYDPSTGRIIYYANMPEGGRSYDYRFMDPINRNFYLNARPYYYDPYYRNYVAPYDYRLPGGFGRGADYMRTGRSSSQAYSYPYQDREKFPRDARYNVDARFDKVNGPREDFRNKTYIIYDADEGRSQFPRNQFEENRLGYNQNNIPLQVPQVPQAPFRNFPQAPQQPDYFPQGGFPFRNQFYPSSSSGPLWGYNQRPGLTESKLNQRPINSPEVQLPLTTSNRALHSSGEGDKSKKP